MFDQLQLKTKRGKKVTVPDESCSSQNRLYSSGQLQVGLGEVITWDDNSLLSLQKLAALYRDLFECTQAPRQAKYLHRFPAATNTILLQWMPLEDKGITLTVSKEQRGQEQILMIKPLSAYQITQWIDTTYARLLAQAAETLSATITQKVGTLFDTHPDPGFLYCPGQKVRTILGTRIRHLRIGYILHRFRYEKDHMYSYQLLVDGRPMNKLYREDELEPVN